MLKTESVQWSTFSIGGREITFKNFAEDTFQIPEHLAILIDEAGWRQIQEVLSFVTNKYLYYLLAYSQGVYFVEDQEAQVSLEDVYLKLIHTNDVIKAAIDIYTLNSELTFADALCEASTHDVARAFQGWFFRLYSDGKTGFDHAEHGAEIIEAVFPELKTVIEGIREHSKLKPEKESYAVKFIRDIDKLAILRRVLDKYQGEAYKLGNGKMITLKVAEYFFNHTLVDRRFVVTEADDLLCMLAWIWDINLEKTCQVLALEQLPERIFERLQNDFEADPILLQKIKTGIYEWYAIHGLGEPEFSETADDATPASEPRSLLREDALSVLAPTLVLQS